MASSLSLLKNYGSDSGETSESDSESNQYDMHLKPMPINSSLSLVSSISVDAAPLVLYTVKILKKKIKN